jgi:pimeloyl-ACP methyl ester carboxylesterase
VTDERDSRLYRSHAAAVAVAEQYEALLSEWPVANTHNHVATCQGKTFVLECGHPDGPPLVLIHGGIANSASWMGDVTTWAPHFHVYAVDVIGEPGLSAPSRPPLDSDECARWLGDVLNALGLAAASIVGISLGGWLALDFAIRRGDRVSSLVLVVPGGVGPQHNVLPWAVPLSLLGKWGRKKVRERILGPRPAELTDTMRRFAELSDHISREFRPRYVKLPIFTDDQLAGLSMPVMAVVAGRDVMLASAPMKRRLELHVRNLTMHYLPEAHHFPGSQAERVLEFLTSVPSLSADTWRPQSLCPN